MDRLNCPKCNHRMRFNLEHVGTLVACAKCSHRFSVARPQAQIRSVSDLPSDAPLPLDGHPSLPAQQVGPLHLAAAIGTVVLVIAIASLASLAWLSSSPPRRVQGTVDGPLRAAKPDVAARTKAAWNLVERIDLELRALEQGSPLSFWERNYIRYGQIDTDHIDTELRTLIEEWIKLSMEMHDLLKSYLEERNRITQEAQSAAQLGAQLGSLDRNNPQAGSAAGALFFGMLGAAAADNRIKQLNGKFEPGWQELCERRRGISRRQDQLSNTLSQKYSLPFRRVKRSDG